MPAAANIQASQLTPLAIHAGSDINVSQLTLSAVYQIPSEGIDVSQLITTAIHSGTKIQNSSLYVAAIYRGRVDQPKVRAWSFKLDQHKFYVLRLGDQKTLVYDMYSQEWFVWYSSGQGRLRFTTGMNWLGAGSFGASYGSNIVAGDDTFGILWFLDPDQPYDDNPSVADSPSNFTRKALAQIPVKGRNALPCFELYLSADQGYTLGVGTEVTLNISDNNGETFSSQDTLTVAAGDYTQELVWRSLGQIRAPGRLFVIEDDGALQRLDSLEITGLSQE